VQFASQHISSRLSAISAQIDADISVFFMHVFVDGAPGRTAMAKELQDYLSGWTVVPPNMLGDGIKNFVPVESTDAAGKRGTASGITMVTAVQDGNGNIHAKTFSDFLGAEGNVTAGSHYRADKALNPIEGEPSAQTLRMHLFARKHVACFGCSCRSTFPFTSDCPLSPSRRVQQTPEAGGRC